MVVDEEVVGGEEVVEIAEQRMEFSAPVVDELAGVF